MMGSGYKKWEKRKAAKKALDAIFEEPDTANVIHYSCESFYNRPTGASPRITSIAVHHVGSRQTISFSIHQAAERKGIDLAQIDQYYNDLERAMLDEFYQYVRAKPNYKWIHWNMRDINYGFLAIEHRYRVLGGEPTQIPNVQLYDLASKLIEIHGRNYANHPRLESIMSLNSISKLDFLTGSQEAEAFENKEYVKLHRSTLRKVDVIRNIADMEWDGTLKTQAKWREEYGTSIVGIVESSTDHWLFKVLGVVGIIASIIGAIALF
jgi:hypothetical protein